jgi:ABC-type sugar transport system substrate-binding protein
MSVSLSRRQVLRLAALAPVVGLVGCSGSPSSGGGKYRVGFMPKLTGIPYFNACHKGAEEAAQEAGLPLNYNGPTKADSSEQIKLLTGWVAGGTIDILCIACNDPTTPAGKLKEARAAGITVITYDADSLPDAREWFVNQATYDSVANLMLDSLAKQMGEEGELGILTSSVQAPNQAEWARRIKARAAEKYPKLTILAETEHGEDRDLGIRKANELIQAHPNLKGIVGLTSVAVPAAGEAVRQKGKKGSIKVGGVSTPRDMRDYVQDGTVESFVLWNPVDLGYLTVHVGVLTRQGKMPKEGTITAGRLKDVVVRNGEVLLGEPLLFTRENIDTFEF